MGISIHNTKGNDLGDNCVLNFNLGRYLTSDIRSEI